MQVSYELSARTHLYATFNVLSYHTYLGPCLARAGGCNLSRKCDYVMSWHQPGQRSLINRGIQCLRIYASSLTSSIISLPALALIEIGPQLKVIVVLVQLP
jgi:hypothetical protein